MNGYYNVSWKSWLHLILTKQKKKIITIKDLWRNSKFMTIFKCWIDPKKMTVCDFKVHSKRDAEGETFRKTLGSDNWFKGVVNM